MRNINFFIYIILVTFHIYPLKLERVILSSDDNPLYAEFWEPVSKIWKEKIGLQPTLAFIATKHVEIDETCGTVLRFEPIDGIPNSFYAQVIRLLVPALFNDGCIISDIDMLPLNKDYFINSISEIDESSFIIYRDGAYRNFPNHYPMCYVAALGTTFKEIFHVNSIEQIPEKVKEWYAQTKEWYSDELLLYKYLNEWSNFKTRCIKLGHTTSRRIDRGNWQYDLNLFKNGYYIDAHLLRPYHQFQQEIDKLIDYIVQ